MRVCVHIQHTYMYLREKDTPEARLANTAGGHGLELMDL